jgi:Uma2 family endonuclease
MGVKTLISEDEYPRMTFDGSEVEYVDGEIVERGMPTNSHSKVCKRFNVIFGKLEERLPLYGLPEIRVRVAPRKYRVIDLGVYAGQEPTEELPLEIPHVAIAVLSPDDRLAEIMRKFSEYQQWGVPHIWLADPSAKRLSAYRDGSLTAVPAFTLPEFNLSISPAEVFR